MHQGKGKLLHSAAAAALLWATTVQAGPMSLDGQFSVSESGAATYTIPIQVPPGTGGVEPKLALTYNSQTGNGLLGVGWSLSGLSAITRCPRTLAQDNVRGSVNFDNNDRFCLDGQRLLAVNGSYGADGTEYRTERESYSKIVSYGTAGNGPAWFKVWTKAGQVIEYGNTADSRIEAIKAPNSTATWPTTTARLWAINKVADTKGNYLTYSYTEDQANGDYYPTRIDYTGNSNTGLTPNNSVQFAYEARQDVAPAYHAGSITKSPVRLIKVQNYQATNLINDLRLTYQVSPTSKRSRIASVAACSLAVCLAPITVSWQDHDLALMQPNVAAPILPGTLPGGYPTMHYTPSFMKYGDFNGDGRTDYLFIPDGYDGRWLIAYGTDTGFTVPDFNQPALPGTINGYFTRNIDAGGSRMQIGDFNGDGKSDYLFMPPDWDGRWFIAYGTDTGLTMPNASNPVLPGTLPGGYYTRHSTPSFTKIGDFNGDGKSDYMFIPDGHDGRWLIAYGTDTGLTLPVFSQPALPGSINGYFTRNIDAGGSRMQIGDFNGDGRSDYMFMPPDWDGRWFIAYGTDTGLTMPDASNPALPGTLPGGYYTRHATPAFTRLGDFNGDGKTDYMFIPDGQDGRWLIAYGTGTGFTVPDFNQPALPGSVNGYFTRNIDADGSRMHMGDFNGDGKTDYLFIPPDADGRWLIAYGSASEGLITPNFNVPALPGSVGGYYTRHTLLQNTVVGDFNGDGRSDFLYVPYAYDGRWVLSARTEPIADQLNSITSGFGVATTITQKPLTQSSVYSKDTGPNASVYPKLDIQSPMYVVSSVSSSNGIGGTVTTNYKYGGLKAEIGTGRGLLGFRWMESTQAETGIITRTEYRQDWPYVGLPSIVKKSLPGAGNNGLLSQVSNSYSCLNPQSGSACTISTGTRYFPYLSQSVESSWDLNGTALPIVTTTHQFDAWGNATQVTVGTNDGYSKTTTNQYSNDATNWYLGRLTRSQVQSVTP